MILDALKRKNVDDDKLWEMVNRANKLTTGSYSNWDDNAPSLLPLMDKLLLRAKEVEDWQVYFYAMSKMIWLARRTAVNDIRRVFWLSEMFHRDSARKIGENASTFAKEWMVDIAARILSFYLDYPQVNDEKIDEMLKIFLDFERRYGSSWNRSNYDTVMWMALMYQDKNLAETAKKKLSQGDFSLWCYICYYGKPMIGYYVLHGDVEGIEEMIASLSERAVPVKYQWCYTSCEGAEEKELAGGALRDCLKYGSAETFHPIFERWKNNYREPEPEREKVKDTHDVLFHALAGDWSRGEDRLRLAEKDDWDEREHREAPLDCLYWALCWHCYFQMLEKQGVKTVRIRLGEEEHETVGNGAEAGQEKEQEDCPEWLCLDAAKYFERRADWLGAQMDKARKRFHYARVKRTYEECFLGTGRPRST